MSARAYCVKKTIQTSTGEIHQRIRDRFIVDLWNGKMIGVILHRESRQGGIKMRLTAGKKVRSIKITAKIPTLNEVINIERRNRFAAAKLKATTEANICSSLLLAVRTSIPEAAYPIHTSYTWYRKDKRTDPSNVAFGIKYIEDALQTAGMIRNDGPKQIERISHHFKYGEEKNWVELTIYSASSSVVDQDCQITSSGENSTPTATSTGNATAPDTATGKHAATSTP